MRVIARLLAIGLAAALAACAASQGPALDIRLDGETILGVAGGV